MPVVEIPGQGNVEFPDSMSGAAIEAAILKITGGRKLAGQPGTPERMAEIKRQIPPGNIWTNMAGPPVKQPTEMPKGQEAISAIRGGQYGLTPAQAIKNLPPENYADMPGIKPLMGMAQPTAITPVAGIAASGAEAAAEWVGTKGAARVMNSLIKPKMREFLFGKNPGRVLSQDGVIANSWEDLGKKVAQNRNGVGENIGQINTVLDESAKAKGITLNTNKAVDVVDKAIASEEGRINYSPSAVERLKAIRGQIAAKSGENSTFAQALDLKREIGNGSSWGANISDDKIVNKTLKQAYGAVKVEMNQAAKKVSPDLYKDYAKLNERYADYTSAESAIRNQAALRERHDLISMPVKVGALLSTALGLIQGGVQGAEVGGAIGGLSMVAVDQLLASPAAKTRIAAALTKMTPEAKTALAKSSPSMQKLLSEVFKKEVAKP